MTPSTWKRYPVVPLIITINAVVFLAWHLASEADSRFMVQNFLVSWSGLGEGNWWTLLSSVFSHNLLWHIFINMYVLRSFGSLLEQFLGSKLFLAFYLGAGIVSSLGHCLVSAWILHSPELPALGASGAIAGLVLVFSLLFPKQKILLFGIIPVPALWGALMFVALDIWGVVKQAEGGGLPIGHGAHLGGALAGAAFYFFYLRSRMKDRAEI